MKTATRLQSENFTVVHRVRDVLGEQMGTHVFDITIARDDLGRVAEIAFVGRGKVGGGLDSLLLDLGVFVSRAIQYRDPMTGAELFGGPKALGATSGVDGA